MWSKATLGFLLAGVGLIVAAIVGAARMMLWISRTKIAAGKVIRAEEVVDFEGEKSWHPVIEFETDGGARSQFRSSVGGGANTWKPGDSVEVRYNPANRQSAGINRLFILFLAPLIMAFVGAIFTGIAAYLHFRRIQK